MNLRRMSVFILAVIMIFTMAACGGKEAEENGGVVKIGEMTITDEQLDQYMYLYCFLQGIDLGKADEENLAYIRSLVLEDYISLNIIKMEYKDKPDILPENYEDAAKEFVSNVAAQEQAAAYMKENKISDEYLKGFYIDQYYSMGFFTDLTSDLPQVTEEEAKAYYEDNPDKFVIDEVTANHILVKEEDLAKEVLAELREGADFGALAKEHSIDGSAANGGSLGTFGRGAMVKEFEDAAFALKPGEISEVVKSQFGYHIIQLLDKKQGKESYEDARQTILDSLNDEAVRNAYTEKITQLREKYKVEYLKAKE
ncbi:peptidylprolyl isomerase [Bacillota bacterium]